MPPKPKLSKKKSNSSNSKKNKKKNGIDLGPCGVQNCKKPAVCAWSSPDRYGYQSDPHFICHDHMLSHYDQDHQFSLHEEFNYEKFEMDEFGVPIVSDKKACLEYLAKHKKKKNSNSIERLREWKKKNPNKKRNKKFSPRKVSAYRKKKVVGGSGGNSKKKAKVKTKAKAKAKVKTKRSTPATMRTKEISKSDMDDVFNDILG